MHGYFWSRVKLIEKLTDYVGGQLQIESTDKGSSGLKTYKMFRGEIKDFRIDIRSRKKEIVVVFEWLCHKNFTVTGKESKEELYLLSSKQPWIQFPSICDMPIRYTAFYFQRDEGRIKLWTNLDEIVHFYEQGDHTNLVKHDTENGDIRYSPYQVVHYKKLLLSFCYAIVLSSKKIKK